MHEKIESHFSSVPSACAALYNELACVYCSPDQGSFISSTPTNYDVLHVCESFCDRFYSACGTAVIKASGKVWHCRGTQEFCLRRALSAHGPLHRLTVVSSYGVVSACVVSAIWFGWRQ